MYVMDLHTITNHLRAADAIICLNNAIVLFDTIADRYDVFKVEMKADASYMLVAGIHDQSHMIEEHSPTRMVGIILMKI